MANKDGYQMSHEEKGRMSGEETSRNHDRDFYQENGRKDGNVANQYRSFYNESGGESSYDETRENLQEMGRGEVNDNMKNEGRDFYQEFGRKDTDSKNKNWGENANQWHKNN